MRTEAGLAALPLRKLLRSTAVMHLCASRALVSGGSELLRAACAAPMIGAPVLLLARHTVLAQFAAGERLHDARLTASQLATWSVRCVVDHSTEESTEPHARQANLAAKLSLLNTLSQEMKAACAFVPIKLTAL
eukprot:6185110-Pleurochrysis_carterae.AAC.1